MSSLSSDEIEQYCHNLVRKVAYAFYEQPYILLFQQLIVYGVCEELELAERLGKLNKHDLRKYLGFLRNHRLVKTRLNKQLIAPTDKGYAYSNFRRGQPQDDGKPRTKDVNYYWIDYREFANVTKYRLAMMRREIEVKSQQSVVSRGYICPTCSHKYAALEVTGLLDPRTGLLKCEQCPDHPEVIEYDPNADPGNAETTEDQMLKFNMATREIQDALKLLEPVVVPSLNMDAWLAKNVRSVVAGDPGTAEDVKSVQVKIGDEGDEKERIEKARLLEAQRIQNALPEWVTHSTVTGGATALGLDAQRRVQSSAAAISTNGRNANEADEHDYYGNMEMASDEEEDEEEEKAGPGPAGVRGKVDGGVAVKQEEGDGTDGGYSDDGYTPAPSAPPTPGETAGAEGAAPGSGVTMVMVAGVAKPIDEVTDEDENDLMTDDEREAYAAILSEM